MAPRRRSNRTRFLLENEARTRVGLDNKARSQKTDAHNRRKPGLLSVAGPEISDVPAPKVSGTLADGNIPNIGAGKINAGTVDKARLPNDTQFGTPKANNISWADGREFVPADAIKGVQWEKVSGAPSFAKQGDIDSSAAAVKRWVKKNYRPK